MSSRFAHLAPVPVELLGAAHVRAVEVLGPTRLAAVQVCLASVTGHRADRPGLVRGRDAWTSYVDQFVLDVTGLRGEPVPVDGLTPAQAKELVTALYVVEAVARIEVMAAAVLGGPEEELPVGDTAGDLRADWHAYQDAAMAGRALDVTTTELVRLRCARTHDCRICSTLRLAEARRAGVDESVTAKVDRYEASDLPERIKVALRLTDAQISRPDLIDEQLVADARTMLSEAERAELILDVAKWSTQKVNVATQTDGIDSLPLGDEGVAFLSFDDDGRVLPHQASVGA